MASALMIPLQSINLAAIEIIDFPGFLELVLRFTLNISVVLILVRWLYYSTTKRKDYLFAYIMISSIVFMICFLLESVKLQLGFALGLFAIFGILRYRTNAMPIKEMTYLFLVIGISVINALTDARSSLADILFTNIVLLFITYGFEKVWLLKHESAKTILYERLELVKPGKMEELIADLQERTGILNIKRVEVGKLNFLKKTCTVTIFYESRNPDNTIPESDSNGNDDDDDE
jgi:hypothetical protein